MGSKITEWAIAIIFFIVGLGVIIGGIFLYVSNLKFKNNAIETTATVVEVSKNVREDADGDVTTTYDEYITYEVNGKTYNTKYASSSYIPEGETIVIYYNRNNPEEMQITLSGVGPIIMMLMGLVFGIVGFAMLSSKICKIKDKKRLKESGKKIDAELSEITVNYSYSVNNKHPFIVICKGSKGEVYYSENLWEDPTPIISANNIKTFPVYIDVNNPERYYLSMEEIEEFKK